MTSRSQSIESDDKEIQRKSNVNLTLNVIFRDSEYESDFNSNLDENENDSDDFDDDIFDGESQLSSKHYLAQAENMNVSQRSNSEET